VDEGALFIRYQVDKDILESVYRDAEKEEYTRKAAMAVEAASKELDDIAYISIFNNIKPLWDNAKPTIEVKPYKSHFSQDDIARIKTVFEAHENSVIGKLSVKSGEFKTSYPGTAIKVDQFLKDAKYEEYKDDVAKRQHDKWMEEARIKNDTGWKWDAYGNKVALDNNWEYHKDGGMFKKNYSHTSEAGYIS
jgi:hypothetical protein